MPDRPRIRLGRVTRSGGQDGIGAFALPMTRAGLEDAVREAAQNGWPLVSISFFQVAKNEIVAYLEPRGLKGFEPDGSGR